MKVGLVAVDGHNNFPNLALMRLSAWHKLRGDTVEWWNGFEHYDRVYRSKVFTFTPDFNSVVNSDEIITGGTGYRDYGTLPPEVESTPPDYSIYPQFKRAMYMGCNDLTSAKYISEKCGKVTISVTNNQMPLMPLFSPVYTSTRPYSQTRSNTQRDLMQPDEVLRLDRRKCIALFQGHKPALLYKLAPEEFPDYGKLKSCRVIDYIPAWRQQEEKTPPRSEAPVPVSVPAQPSPEQTAPETVKVNPAEDLEYQVETAERSNSSSLGMVEVTIDGVCGEDEDSPPGR